MVSVITEVCAYPDIAVALSSTEGDLAAYEAAVALSRTFGSRVELLHLLVLPVPVVNAWSFVGDAAYCEAYDVMREDAADEAQGWRERLAQDGVPGQVEMLEVLNVEPASLAASAARSCDLSIIGGPGANGVDGAVVHEYFAGLLFESGKPVLLVPTGAVPALPPRRAVIAWSDTPEAARAVQSALPFLQRCESVDLVCIEEAVARASDARDRMVERLHRRGVPVVPVTLARGDATVAQRLMEHALGTHAELIVAGGYGHSRLREWTFGGVTREMFFAARVPVLFAH